MLACYRYIELNPLRAAMVDAPGGSPGSSYGANADGRPDPLLTPHPVYASLASEPPLRRERYRALVAEAG